MMQILFDQEMRDSTMKFNKQVQEENELPPQKLVTAKVGWQDAKKHLEDYAHLQNNLGIISACPVREHHQEFALLNFQHRVWLCVSILLLSQSLSSIPSMKILLLYISKSSILEIVKFGL